MLKQLDPAAESYVRSINDRDPAALLDLFAEDATVDDNGREFVGRTAIKEWSDREIFAANVSLELLDVTERDGATVITTKVDGTFDRTGLPDPVIIDQTINMKGGKIARLTCRLANQ